MHLKKSQSETPPPIPLSCTLWNLTLNISKKKRLDLVVCGCSANLSQFLSLSPKIICWLKDYYLVEKYLLLPPFQPNSILPQEVLDAYQVAKETIKLKSADPDSVFPSEVNMITSYLSIDQPAENLQVKVSSTDYVGTYESKSAQSSITRSVNSSACSLNRITQATGFTIPTIRTIDGFSVEEALARHIGVDISLEGIVAEKRRGVMMIVYGPALSGKTTQSKFLANFYDGVVLDIDTILIEAISSACTEVGIKARMLCYQSMLAKIVDSSETGGAGACLLPKKQTLVVKEKDKEKDQQLTDSVSYLKPPSQFKVDPYIDMPYAVPEGTLMPTVLQEDIIVDILADRFARPDCLKAVVIDGIESCFTSLSLQLVLRAFNNRAHIYFVHLGLEFHVIKERQEEMYLEKLVKSKEEEKRKKEERICEEQQVNALLEMDEDEYELLTEEQQDEIDAIRLKRRKVWRLKKEQEKKEFLRLKRERKEEEERLKEEEKLKKKGKRDKKVQQTKILPNATAGGSTMPTRSGSIVSAAVIGPTSSSLVGGIPASCSAISTGSGLDSPINTMSYATPKHAKIKRKASPKVARQAEVDHVLEKSYFNYKLGMEGLKVVLDDWDRQKGINRFKEPEESKTTPVRKGKGSKIKEQEPTAQQAITDSEENREGMGVPFIDIDGSQSMSDISEKIMASGLPSYKDILNGLGLGPSGTPIPNPVTLQVCPFPLKREAIKQEPGMFFFVSTSPDDL